MINGAQNNVAIVIPARMASTRLPGKPLADLAGEAMIVHVWRRAIEADCGEVIVATAEPETASVIKAVGGTACITPAALPSGSDRVAAALAMLDPERRFHTVINLQGDLPTIAPDLIRRSLDPLDDPAVDIATLAVAVDDADKRADPNVVKVLGEFDAGAGLGRARDFARALPADHSGPHYHHIGLYAYRRSVLETFVALPPSRREREARLEQLRALDAGMRIDVALVDTVPHGVDTPADLERVRAMMARS